MKQITQSELIKLIKNMQDNSVLEEEQSAYQEIIDELNDVEIVPDPNKIPITPYVEPKVEPLRNDRFRDFEKDNFYVSLDAKDAKTITMQYNRMYETIEICVDDYCVKQFFKVKEFEGLDKKQALDFYKDLIEWRNYWKQN